MSRQIDLTKPLSDEDRAYLDTRARHDLIALNDEQFGSSEQGSDEAPTTSSQAEQENLQVSNEDDYEEMTNEDLREELSDRGLSTSGNKAELIARLRENDASE